MDLCFFGASGKVGSQIYPELQSLACNSWSVARETFLTHFKGKTFYLDLTKPWSKDAINFLNNFEVFLYFAKTDDDKSVFSNFEYLSNFPQRKIIYASSIRIFAKSVGKIDKNTNPNIFQDDQYATNKLSTELYLQKLSLKKGWDCHALRLGELPNHNLPHHLNLFRRILYSFLGGGFLHFIERDVLINKINRIISSHFQPGFYKHFCTTNTPIKKVYNLLFSTSCLPFFLLKYFIFRSSFRTRCFFCYFCEEGTHTHQISPHRN